MSYYTEDEIAQFAKAQNCSITDFKERWIIAICGTYFIHGPGGYLPPIKSSDLQASIKRDLVKVPSEEASAAGICWRQDDKRKSNEAIIFEYGTVARHLISDMALQHSYYDAEAQTFYEAVCPLARIEPVFHHDIAEWLYLFSKDKYEKFQDWLATLTLLNRPTCALLITGRPGAGKEMLAQGLARLWKRAKAPTELARVMGNFNEDLSRCPLIFCDEELPRINSKRLRLADLRSMIASSQRTLARKFLTSADLLGSIRLIIAGNNTNMLADYEDMTQDDQQATAERFLHLGIGDEPVDFLKKIGGRKTTEMWVTGGKIAEHVTWLARNRQVETGSRFLVQGDAADIQAKLVINNKHASPVLECLARYLSEDRPNSRDVIVGDGKVLINTSEIIRLWNQYITNAPIPSTQRLGATVRNISHGEEQHRLDTSIRYFSIKIDLVYEWVRENQIGNLEISRSRIAKKVKWEELKKQYPPKDVLPPFPN